MADGAAEALANEILAGTYTPGLLDNCASTLTLDRNPQAVTFTQFILFAEPGLDARSPSEPDYMIFQQFDREGHGPRMPGASIIDEIVKPMATALSQQLAKESWPQSGDPLAPGFSPVDGGPGLGGARTREAAPMGELPDPYDEGVDADRLRLIAMERTIPGYSPNAGVVELRRLYADWHRRGQYQALQQALEPLERAGFRLGDEVATLLRPTPELLTKILTPVFLPPLYQPFHVPNPHVALFAVIEQVWEPKGYTRGELINTISLAPGEQQTLEVRSWDKTATKTEEEVSRESELKVAETATQRDILTVARETATKFGGHLDVSTTVKVKNVPVQVNGGVNTEVTQKVSRTLEQTRERTIEASQTLKTTRKLRIEVTREVGREQKQTRVITNTNRCHTLNCHYFEVMANYVVTTHVRDLRPCLLLPNPPFRVTPAWVLCHEASLKAALLNRAYMPGFDGARVHEANTIFEEAKKAERKAKGEVATEHNAELKGLLDGVVDAYKRLTDSAKTVREHARSWECKVAKKTGGSLAQAVCVALKSGGLARLRRLLYSAMLHVNEPVINALRKLYDVRSTTTPAAALRDFLAVVSPRDVQFNPATAAIAKGLDALGVPDKLVDGLLSWGLLDLIADDAGLYNAVQAAAARLDQLWGLPPTEQPQAKEGYSAMELAQARVAYEQLRCHIEDYWLHYAQTIWWTEHPDERFLRLQAYGSISAILDNQIVGFLGHKAAYPLSDPAAITALDLATLVRDVKGHFAETQPVPYLVTVPTPGTVLEAVVGECDACEDFIQKSRVYDLQTQTAKAEQETQEARRFRLRLEQVPPVLDDPRGGRGSVTINVDTDEGNSPPS